MTQPEQPERESALSPEDRKDADSDRLHAVNTSNDVPVQPSTRINMQRQSRRIE